MTERAKLYPYAQATTMTNTEKASFSARVLEIDAERAVATIEQALRTQVRDLRRRGS